MNKLLALLACLILATAPALAIPWVQPVGVDGINPASATNPVPMEIEATTNALVKVTGVNGTSIATGANGFPVLIYQGTTALSATNGIYANLLINNTLVSASAPVPISATAAANAVGNTIFVSPVQAGAAVGVGNPLYIQGTVTTSGGAAAATYMASTGAFTPYATPTDVWTCGGAASKTIKIRKITLWSTQTTSGTNNWYLIKRSTANSGGTFSASTKIPVNAASAASSAVVGHWTVAPTTGTAIGNLKVMRVGTPAPDATTNTAMFPTVIYEHVNTQTEPLTLTAAAQEVDLNFNGAAVPAGLSISVDVEYTEE